jgi:hypothetical protein
VHESLREALHALGCCSSAALHFKKGSNPVNLGTSLTRHFSHACGQVCSIRYLCNVRRFCRLGVYPWLSGTLLYFSHVQLLTGAASQRATPVWTPKVALPGTCTGGAKDSVGRGIPSAALSLSPRDAGLQAGERAPSLQAAQKLDRYRKQASGHGRHSKWNRVCWTR